MLTVGFGRRFKVRDHVMIVLQFLSYMHVHLQTKKGVLANHDENGNENVSAVY